MRIGINALAWVPEQQAGVAVYLRQLLAALQAIDAENEYILYVARGAQGQADLRGENFREIACAVPRRWRPGRVLWEQTALAGRVRAGGVDVMLCAGGLVPGNLGIPAVQMIHDLQVFHYPENFSWAKRRFLTAMLPRSARAASLTLASSEYTRADVIKLLGQPRSRTRVALLAGDSRYQPTSGQAIRAAKDKYGIGEEYLLCVATTHRHKNVAALVRAYDRVAEAGERRCEIVLVGKRGSGHRAVMNAVSGARHREGIKLPGRVPREDLAALYSGATAFVLPSLFEGFGMTVLEAMQCGCPVACSSLTALPEVAGDAALLFDPRDDGAFAEAVQRITEDEALRTELREKGRARAQEFSWERTAGQTQTALLDAGGGERSGKQSRGSLMDRRTATHADRSP